MDRALDKSRFNSHIFETVTSKILAQKNIDAESLMKAAAVAKSIEHLTYRRSSF